MIRPVRVLIVDDSTLMRKMLSTLLVQDPDIEVVGTAADAMAARESIKVLNPDVVTLDIEMPQMDGLSFLRKIIELRPMPVIMVSSLTHVGAEATIEALEIGAADFVEKPAVAGEEAIHRLGSALRAKIKAAAQIRFSKRPRRSGYTDHRTSTVRAAKVVAIGASTGGVESLRAVLNNMGEDCPPILVAQHMPERFTTAFANRLNRVCPMEVREAVHREPLLAGVVYIAPGNHHLEVMRYGAKFYTALRDTPPVSGHRPSVDVLFRSVAEQFGAEALGIILTGMGKDGAEGLMAMRKSGASTIGQDEHSSLIYGMPREAFERGAVERQLPLDQIGQTIMTAWQQSERGSPGSPAMAHEVTK